MSDGGYVGLRVLPLQLDLLLGYLVRGWRDLGIGMQRRVHWEVKGR